MRLYGIPSTAGSGAGSTEGGATRERSVVAFEIEGSRFEVLSVPLRDGHELDVLSAAEREVATLAALGQCNAAIARSRRTSVRTIANQMASVFAKLRVGSRYALTARLARCPLRGGQP